MKLFLKLSIKYTSTLLVLTLLQSFQNAFAQNKLEYDILFHGIKVGKLTASKEQPNNSNINYELNSHAKFKMFLSYSVAYDLYTNYENGILNSSKLHNKVNGKEKSRVEIKRDQEKHYFISSLDEKIHELRPKHSEQQFDFSISKLYFQEPINKSFVFSEKYGIFLKIINLGNRKYKIVLPDNSNSVYHFNINGVCESVDMNRGISSFKVKLIN